MADEATTAPSVDAPAPAAAAEAVEPLPVNGDAAEVPKEDEETAGKQATTEVTAPDGDGTAEVAEAPSAVAATDEADATPASGKKEKRKSSGGVPEHKGKKLNKKKSMPTLHLNCQPGELYWARLKGYPPWPAIICDEAMLPESLLGSRPVSTTRPDGTLRDDFREGGKNSKERTFPIMFLATNEFAWMVNTGLTPLDPEECKTLPSAKMTKDLRSAWQLASENHDLQYFKGILKTWAEENIRIDKERAEEAEREAARAEEQARIEAEEAAKAAEDETKPKKKPKSRKSKGGDEDVDMEDADVPKSSKKRKKEAESDADGSKPKKTPKVTKLNAPKTPNGTASAAKSSKKKVVQAPKDDDEETKQEMSEAEKVAAREKLVLYLRHRLQKGFLSRDQAPQEAEMAAMNDYFNQLEAYESLEPAIIRATKVHKVLKAIVKLSSIPREEEYNFKKRSAAMLEIWNKRMESDGDNAPPSAVEPETNGEKAATPAAVTPAEPKEDSETKLGAEEEVEVKAEEAAEEEVKVKAEEAADKLDEKVAPTVEDKMDVVERPAVPISTPAEKTERSTDAMDVTTAGEAAKEATNEVATATAGEAA